MDENILYLGMSFSTFIDVCTWKGQIALYVNNTSASTRTDSEGPLLWQSSWEEVTASMRAAAGSWNSTEVRSLPVESGINLSAASHGGSFTDKSFRSQEGWRERVRTREHLPEEGLCGGQGALVSTGEKTGIAPLSQGLLLLRIIKRKENEDAQEGM